MTGGGSGGHITPILAVAHELKKIESACSVAYIGQRGDGLADVPAADPNIDQVYSVRAGKFRRYHGEGWRQLLDVSTMLMNIRDSVYVLLGLLQSYRLLRRLQPDVIFVKGGFVGVPVGLAAAMLRIPYVTHDSDAIPGLANRIIARWARLHTVALPAESYPYPQDKTVSVGIPLVADFKPVSEPMKKAYRRDIAMPTSAKMLFIVGGGLGAQRINSAVLEVLPHLLAELSEHHVVHGVGRANETTVSAAYNDILTQAARERVTVVGYIHDLYRYSGAADIIVTRAGATNLAEFSMQGKACIVIPSPFLAGGHQVKNARVLESKGAAVVLPEVDMQADPNFLARAISDLLKEPARISALGNQLGKLAHPNSAELLAKILLKETNSP